MLGRKGTVTPAGLSQCLSRLGRGDGCHPDAVMHPEGAASEDRQLPALLHSSQLVSRFLLKGISKPRNSMAAPFALFMGQLINGSHAIHPCPHDHSTPVQRDQWRGELMSTDQNILSVLLFSVFSTVGTCFLGDITRDVKPFTLQLYSHTSLHNV